MTPYDRNTNAINLLKKFGLQLSVFLLAACTTTLTAPTPEPPGRLSTFGYLTERVNTSANAPLGDESWVTHMGEARVPVFDSGTPLIEALKVLREWGLDPLVGPETIILEEGPSRHNYEAGEAEYVIYAFTEGVLNIGPLSSDEMVNVYLRWGLHPEDFALVTAITALQPLSTTSLNNLAWALSTFQDASKRSPALAVQFSRQANELSGWEDSDYLDTLAAAYASSGDFENAVAFQRKAIECAADADPEMAKRLVFYENGIPFVQLVQAVTDRGAILPTKSLVGRARRGDADAQYELAAFFLEGNIDEYDGVKNPGLHYLRLSADQDNLRAIEEMGFGYLRGSHGLEQDPATSREWLLMASEMGSDLAAYNLGMMYRDGIGIERDEALATKWLMLSADRGISVVAVDVAYRLLEGAGVEQNPVLASEYFAKAKEGGVGPLNSIYGEKLHPFSYVFNADYAATQPNPVIADTEFPEHLMLIVDAIESQVAHGTDYIYGHLTDGWTGWPVSDAPEVIFALTHSAATFGSRRGQLKLAQLYQKGLGVDALPEEAKYWRQRAQRNKAAL